MSDRKSLSVSLGTHRQLEKLGDQLGLSHKDLVSAMVQFFAVTKLDPRYPKADSPDVVLKKLADKVDALDKRFIGFIREQEKAILKPMQADVQALRQAVELESNAILSAKELENQLTGAVEAIQMLLQVSLRTAFVDNALKSEFKQRADQLLTDLDRDDD
jgi:hypothetical protein